MASTGWSPASVFPLSLSLTLTVDLGKEIGIVLTTPLVSQLCASTFLGGWPSAFYLSGKYLVSSLPQQSNVAHAGLVSCLWFIGWSLFAYNSPSEHPRITYAEKLYLLRSVPKPKKVRRSFAR